MPVDLIINDLGDLFQDYRRNIPGESFNWGPQIVTSKIDAFVFHHSVSPQTAKQDGNWKAECDHIANIHINQGWAGVGYRFIIASNGIVAYVGDLSHGGSAITNHNDHVFSACLVGDFTKELPTAAQVHSAHILSKHFLQKMPQYPNLKDWEQIKGHQDFMPTICPSPVWRNGQDTLRQRIIDDRFAGYPDPQPVDITTLLDNNKVVLAAAKQKIDELAKLLSEIKL